MKSATLTRDAIDIAGLLAAVAHDGAGAITLFAGTVRDHNDGRDVIGIEYDAYDAMAAAEMTRIVDEAVGQFPGIRITVVHRLGELGVGEVSVAIACASPHRAAALDACRYVIEQLKKRVPIWKRELYADGTREWVDPTRPRTGMTAS